MNALKEQTVAELNRRYNTAFLTTAAGIVFTIALCLAAWYTTDRPLSIADDPTSTAAALWITILVFAIGAFLLRRIWLGAAALRDVRNSRGASGVLKRLQTATIIIVGAGGVIAILGFLISMLTNNAADMIRAAAVSLIVLLVGLPRRALWRRLAGSVNS